MRSKDWSDHSVLALSSAGIHHKIVPNVSELWFLSKSFGDVKCIQTAKCLKYYKHLLSFPLFTKNDGIKYRRRSFGVRLIFAEVTVNMTARKYDE